MENSFPKSVNFQSGSVQGNKTVTGGKDCSEDRYLGKLPPIPWPTKLVNEGENSTF